MAQVAGPTAALAGVPAGLQAQGVWSGRRQIFVRFAAEAETATRLSQIVVAAAVVIPPEEKEENPTLLQ